MLRKRYKPGEIVAKPRQVSQGQSVGEAMPVLASLCHA